MSERDYTNFFKDADKDGSGTLSMDELVKAIRKAGFRGSDSQLKGMFQRADTSGDGLVTLQEFLECMGVVPPAEKTKSSMRYVFQQYDKDGNGIIDRSEVKAIWTDMKKTLPEEQVDTVMKWMDKNNDQQINYEEFLAYYTT